MAMICRSCGKTIPHQDSFCVYCGQRLRRLQIPTWGQWLLGVAVVGAVAIGVIGYALSNTSPDNPVVSPDVTQPADQTTETMTLPTISDSTAESDLPNTQLADLVISKITWLPSAPSVGDVVTFSVTIRNQGEGDAELTKVECFIDDTMEYPYVVDSIPAGTFDIMIFDWTADAGTHDIKVIADFNDDIPEHKESNNTLEAIVSVSSSPPETTSPVAKPGTLKVVSSPGDVSLYLDDEFSGITVSWGEATVQGIMAGTYTLKLTKDGYKDWTKQVTITSDSTTTLNAYLEGE